VRHLIFRMAVLGGLVAGVVVIPATMASAHAPFTAGPYSFAVGFGTEPAYVGIPNSIEVIIMLVLGGIGSITGAIIGATALTLLPELLRMFGIDQAYPGMRMVIYALILILLMIFRPQGLFGRREFGWGWLRRPSIRPPRSSRPRSR